VYCKGLTINKAKVQLAPGTYVIRDGVMKLNSEAEVTGTGVMLFFMGKEGRLDVNSHSTLKISAPTSGTYNGIVMFQSRDPITLQTDKHTFNSHSYGSMEGFIYAPNGQFQMNSHSELTTTGLSGIIARKLEANSHAELVLDGSKSPLKDAALPNEVRLVH
jgi:hypothetical protein